MVILHMLELTKLAINITTSGINVSPQYIGHRYIWATVNGGNGKWKRKRKVETENRNGKRKREMVVTAIRTSYQCQDRSSSSKSRSASLGRCKTWTLDSGTHELTDIWTPDKTINDDMIHMPCIQPCPSSVQCTSGGFGD